MAIQIAKMIHPRIIYMIKKILEVPSFGINAKVFLLALWLIVITASYLAKNGLPTIILVLGSHP